MAMIRAKKLTIAEQLVIDKAMLSILNTWPGLNYGEFPGEGITAEYELHLFKVPASMVRARVNSARDDLRVMRDIEAEETGEATEGLGFAKLPAHRGNSEQFVKST